MILGVPILKHFRVARRQREGHLVFIVSEKGLGEPCQYTKECRGAHTQCDGMQCTCEFGFLVINGTDSCSGKTRL